MLVEFTRHDGSKVSINADAVAWVEPSTLDMGGSCICISGKEGESIYVAMDYRLAVEQLQDAMS